MIVCSISIQVNKLTIKRTSNTHHWWPSWDVFPLMWRHNERDSVSNHRCLYCLLNRLFRCRPKITSKLRVRHWPLCGEFTGGNSPAQRASNAKNVSIWWRHHEGGTNYPYGFDAWKWYEISPRKFEYGLKLRRYQVVAVHAHKLCKVYVICWKSG